MHRFLIILIFFGCFSSCVLPERRPVSPIGGSSVSVKLPKQDYDTLPNGLRLFDNRDSYLHGEVHYRTVAGSDTLKGGYITCYGIDDSLLYFYLRHGDTLHLLSQAPHYGSSSSHGDLEKDFEDYFLVSHLQPSMFPFTYSLFEKKSGQNMLGEHIEIAGYTVLKDTLFVLYGNWTPDRGTDSITLFNANTRTKEVFTLAQRLPNYCSIDIVNLTRSKLTIHVSAYFGDRFEKTIVFKRSFL